MPASALHLEHLDYTPVCTVSEEGTLAYSFPHRTESLLHEVKTQSPSSPCESFCSSSLALGHTFLKMPTQFDCFFCTPFMMYYGITIYLYEGEPKTATSYTICSKRAFEWS